MVRFTHEPKERVGLFAVRKDDGLKQRLIVDARRSNLRLHACPNAALLSSESCPKLEVDSDAVPTAWFGITDIKDCSHNMLTPEWISDYFSLMPVTAGEVEIEGSTLLQNSHRVALGNDILVTPAWAVLPMGCSWSLYFAQSAIEATASRAPALEEPLPSSRQVGGPLPWSAQGCSSVLRACRPFRSDCEDAAGGRHCFEPVEGPLC